MMAARLRPAAGLMPLSGLIAAAGLMPLSRLMAAAGLMAGGLRPAGQLMPPT
jgi:hypothetical protein